jgi:regulatory protein
LFNIKQQLDTNLFLFLAPMIDSNQLKLKMARFCAWRERCSFESEEKLYQLGATDKQSKELLKWLEEENYLNDERFARSFAQGKFSNNNWGKHRILAELKARKIDQLIILAAINLIDDTQYKQTATRLAKKKWNEIKTEDSFIKKQKVAAYLVGKGFEMDLVWKILEKTKF